MKEFGKSEAVNSKRSKVVRSLQTMTSGKLKSSVRTSVVMGFALAMGLIVGGCGRIGEDRPTEEQGKTAILNHLKQQENCGGHIQYAYDREGAIKIVGFRKTNGMIMDMMGVKRYQLEFECQIEFDHDCTWTDKTGFENTQGSFMTGMDGRTQAKKGQQAKVTGQIWFEKTEKGWRFYNIAPN